MPQTFLLNSDKQRKSKMRVSIISFTETGANLSLQLQEGLSEQEVLLYTKCKALRGTQRKITYVEEPLQTWVGQQMEMKTVLLFVGACGIAVRSIAPHVVNKLQDSPVIVVDENGKFVIPILSGHMGGANDFACLVSEQIGSQPVITTATDIQGKFAVDLFAKRNHLWIENKDGIAKVSSKVLRGETITISIEEGHLRGEKCIPEGVSITAYPPQNPVDVVVSGEEQSFLTSITLKPKEYILGVGCRKGKEKEKLEKIIAWLLEKHQIKIEQIRAITSIDRKAEEEAILAWSQKYRIPFLTYSGEELEQVKGEFQESEFVRQTVGIGNVCERTALKAAGTNGRLIMKKHAEDGMTIAIAKKEWSVTLDET